MATKCLKINDSITNPTTGGAVTGIVCVAAAAEGTPKNDGTQDMYFNIRMKYFLTEADYDAKNQPILWDNLPKQCTVDVTEAEWDGTDASPKYGNDLVYSKLLAWLTDVNGGNYATVVEISKP